MARCCKQPECCTRAKHARSWRVAPAVALQDKSPRLARPFSRGLNSRLNLVTRSSRQNTLFGKNWLFTFLLTLLYIYPYTHNLERASGENFWERNPREKQDWLIHNLYLKNSSNSSILFSPLSNPWQAYYQNLISPFPFLWERFLVFGKQLGRNQFYIGWCYGQVAESGC